MTSTGTPIAFKSSVKSVSGLAKQNPEGAKQSSDLILELDPNANEHLAGGEQRADLVAGSALDADLLEPTRANDLGQGRCVVPIRLVRPHFERGVRMARIHADHGQAFCVELVPEPHGERSRLHPDPHQAGSILCKPTGK